MADDKQERAKAIDAALAQIDKQFGKGSIMRLGSREKVDIPAIPTGSLSLDAALGVGGMPRGRVVEIYGPESSGKTTLALHVIAEAQKRGGMAAFVDAEHALDAVYAGKLGVDIDNLLVSQPDTASRRSRSPRSSSAPAPSTSWSWTRWPPSSPAPSSRARWATRRWACRRGS